MKNQYAVDIIISDTQRVTWEGPAEDPRQAASEARNWFEETYGFAPPRLEGARIVTVLTSSHQLACTR